MLLDILNRNFIWLHIKIIYLNSLLVIFSSNFHEPQRSSVEKSGKGGGGEKASIDFSLQVSSF